MNELVKVDPKEFGLEESKANELTSGLTTILEERKVLIDSYVETIKLEITEENLPIFKELRLQIRDNRTKGIEPWHKVNKQFFLTGGRFVDAIKNKEVAENERMEAKLMEAEKYFENLEKERIENLTAERYESCLPFVDDISLILPDLGVMPESLWNNYIIGLEASFKAKKAEEKRIEEDKINNERLDKLANDRYSIAIQYKRFWEHENYDFRDMCQDEFNSMIDNYKDLEIKDKKIQEENEKKAIEEAEILKQFELNKGDSEKVTDLIYDLTLLKTKYSFKSAKNVKMYNQVNELLDKVINHIEK